MQYLTPTLLLLSLFQRSYAGNLTRGEACSVSENRLQLGTYQYWDECDVVSFCSEEEGVCVARRCRKDEYPFGYTPGMTFPDKCPEGHFCPDEGSDCQPLLPVGSPCQLNRDDQCEPPPNADELADKTGRGLNVNGAICLNNICMWANETEGNDCVLENTPYIAYGIEGEFINIVSRGNCRTGFYCDGPTRKCLANKLEGDKCEADKECDSMNCLSSGVCGVPAATPHKFGIWAYVLVAIGILGGMGGTLTGLYLAHRKQRDIEREKRLQYWREQNAFHQNLMQMREAARASILSLPNGGSPRSTLYGRELSDESHAPMMQNAGPKSSGLRHYVGDDSSDFEDLNQPAKKADNRF
ncbi:hypothetical protein CC1G_14143 [Coprinopsis cinerea okayama7|uniref:Uncharacterized protein n=1 Tax=Coprinopsis cinerea (strain Okayama-7 / 130 / ATCC MYA-4618 / FGSC 9003) TaxID=240176 RepID=D6RLK4_COPC7|nr:hypothetical protein CC1G_14143 [Coprinopsis cinerea okayama7\|eukprot:XP_002911610.1 hypothetical protein CC1G_14143 [Coprinopsis cinerea okayama7\